MSQQQYYSHRATDANYEKSIKGGVSTYSLQTMGLSRTENNRDKEVYRYNNESKDLVIQNMSEELKKRDEEIEYLRTRLSQLSSEKLRQGNPNIADLSDTNRPTKLAEHFSELYSNEWTNAFEEISINETKEKLIIEQLLRIIKHSYKYCLQISNQQLETIKRSFAKDVILPVADKVDLTVEMSESNKELEEIFSVITELRKRVGVLSLPQIKQTFAEMVHEELKIPVKDDSSLNTYVNRCVELCWFMCMQDPPMCMEWCQAGDRNTGDFMSYTRSGSTVDFCVWPCVRQYKGGPLMTKGVAQMQ